MSITTFTAGLVLTGVSATRFLTRGATGVAGPILAFIAGVIMMALVIDQVRQY